MVNYFLPTPNIPNSEYTIKLSGSTYSITTRWNETDEAWYMDIIGLTNTVKYYGIKLVSGADLLAPYVILELGHMFIVDLEERNSDPNFDDFGTRFRIAYMERS